MKVRALHDEMIADIAIRRCRVAGSERSALGRREGLDPGPYRAPDSALARARRDLLERNVDRQTDVPRGSRSCGVDEFVGDPRSDTVRVRARQPEHNVREAGGDGAVDRIAGNVGSVVGHR